MYVESNSKTIRTLLSIEVGVPSRFELDEVPLAELG